MNDIFYSKRLVFREFTTADASLLFGLNNDEEVRKYVHEPIPTVDSIKHSLHEVILPQYKLYNYGRWALYIKENNEFIGWCGLKYIIEQKEIDLSYRLMKKYWGKGYATEAAKSTISYGFQQLHLPIIIARAYIENLGSLKVIEKCGMKFLYEGIYQGQPVKTYQITAADLFVQ